MHLKELLLLPSSFFPHDSVSCICNRETKECSECQAPILKHPLLALGRKPTRLLHSSRHRQPVLISEVWKQTLCFQLLTPMSRKSLELKKKKGFMPLERMLKKKAKSSWSPRFIFLCCKKDHSIGLYNYSQVKKSWKPSQRSILSLPMGRKAASILENLKAHLHACWAPSWLATYCVIDCTFHYCWHWLPPEKVLNGYGPWCLGLEPTVSQLGSFI